MRALWAGIVLSVAGTVASAEAGVIYRWENVTIDPKVGPIEGALEFDRRLWREHSLDWPRLLGYSDLAGADPQPASGHALITVSFNSNLVPVDFRFWPCSSQYRSDFCEQSGISPDELVIEIGYWTGGEVTRFGHLLTGDLYFGAGDVDESITGAFYEMSSDNKGLWTIWDVSTDSPWYPCYERVEDECLGATGYWRLDPTSVDEPGQPPLMLLGLAMLLGLPLAIDTRGRAASIAR